MRAVGLALLTALVLAVPAHGATVLVTTTQDAPPPGCGAGQCSLRQALAAAQPGDEVRVPAAAQPYALRADLGQLVVAQGGVHIAGADARRTLVRGGGAARVLAVAAGVPGVTISGLTVTGGGTSVDPRGGGVLVAPGAELTLRDVAVVANSAGAGALGGRGGGIFNAGTLVLDRVLVAHNLAGNTGIAFGQGGGVFNEGDLRAENVTVARNTAGGAVALSGGGGIFTAAPGTSRLSSTTISTNRAAAIGTGANLYSEGARTELRNTIVARAIGATSCGGGVTSSGANLSDSAQCGLGAGRDLRLGPLQDNGGPTDTQVPGPGSPAIDAGAQCPGIDQRGAPRPQGAGCDVGAAEHGSLSPATALPAPQRGATVNLARSSGRVRYLLPGAKRFARLDANQQVPVGTVVDTDRGAVVLAAARDEAGTVDRARFSEGTFAVGQEATGAGRSVTTIKLRGELAGCSGQGRAGAAATQRRRKRRVWGSGKGTFRTQGRHSSATVRGTRWLTEDTCDGTLTRVREGVVDVRDHVLRRTVRVRAGSTYLARPYRCASRRQFRISVPVGRKLDVRSATAVVAGRRFRLAREPRRVTGVVDLRGLVKGTFTVRVRIVLAGGRVLGDVRTYRTCRRD